MVFETERLIIRKAILTDEDVEFLYKIWTNPEVMKFVGFPNGLRITRDEIRQGITDRSTTEYNHYLIIELKESHRMIGECKLGPPDNDGVAGTDVKLMPEFWGNKYGAEVKRGLVDYLFTHTDCKIIQATPNKKNIASQKMQEAVGGRRVREEVYKFPEKMRDYTCDIPLYVYHVFREDWGKK